MWRMSLGALAVFLVLSYPVRAEEPTPEKPAADVPALVRELGSHEWQDRQAAQEKLVALGTPVVGDLQAALNRASDPEIAAALEVVLSQIALNEASGQTRVTLKLDEVTAEEAFGALARQAGVKLEGHPDKLWQQRQARLSIDVVDQPFWEVFRELSRKTGLNVRSQRNPGTLVLEAGKTDDLFGPTAHSGAFMIVVNSAERRWTVDYSGVKDPARSLTLRMRVYAEPKLQLHGRTMGAVLEEVRTEDGTSLLDPEATQSSGMTGDGAQTFPITLRLIPPAQADQRLAVLKGYFEVAAEVRTETLEVEDLASANNVSRTVGGMQLLINTTKKDDSTYEIVVGSLRSATLPSYWDKAIEKPGMVILDAAGEALQVTRSAQRTPGGWTQTRLTMKLSGKNKDRGPPAKLQWTLPVEIREMRVPFDLSGQVTLP